MMSQRPSGSSSNNSKPAASSSSGSGTIGKYKGVMLCNRPTRGPAQAGNTANKTLSSGRLAPFRAGGHNPIENDIGLTRARPKRHAAPRKKVETVTAKHKKWLAQFTAEKLRLEAEMEKEELEKKKNREKFMARERRLRNAITKNVKKDEDQEQAQPQTSSRAETPGDKRDKELEDLLKFTDDINDEDFDQQMEEMLQDDNDADWVGELLDQELGKEPLEFDPESDDNELVHPDTGASGYDGDDAISRAEWRQRMVETVDPDTGEPSDADDAVSRRDYLIEQGVDVQRLHAGDIRSRAAVSSSGVGLTEEAVREWKSKHEGADYPQNEEKDDDVMSTASAVLADSRKIRSVHSARSVAAIARQQEMRVSKIDRLPEIHEIKEIAAPKIVTLDEKRLEYKKHPNQLPYMNRNPAV